MEMNRKRKSLISSVLLKDVRIDKFKIAAGKYRLYALLNAVLSSIATYWADDQMWFGQINIQSVHF
ncbi:hypothetical protein CLV32_2154 [Pedobacter duraquae]|uniref:Uncharacterized protein n=1 Tax=Pedobacter duraquae TaxID=425511 RepID=A0A4R6IM32_9SPHI|nr:hypothetical protein CLV32_2154 [Pedobacter duraquae]